MKQNPAATVLTFNLSEDHFARLRGLAVPLGVRVKAVPPESFSLPLGPMAGVSAGPAAAAPADGFDDPMLLMCHLDDSQFNQFLFLLRISGLPRVDLKAVLTPANAHWNAGQLHAELVRERDALSTRRGDGQ